MEEEFQESEVIFSDNYEHDRSSLRWPNLENSGNSFYYTMSMGRSKKKQQAKSTSPASVPVNIAPSNGYDQFDDEDYDEDELVPPHVIVGRRIAGKMAFSVCTGNGRTLKGRDLSQVRNSILRLTGFLET